jgi:CheY-like chemotaxis protein
VSETTTATPIRTVVADDSVLLRDGVVRLLADSGFDVVAAVGDAQALLDAVTEHDPDLCIVDVRMPPTFTDEGLRAAIEIKRRSPNVAVAAVAIRRGVTPAIAHRNVSVWLLVEGPCDRRRRLRRLAAASRRWRERGRHRSDQPDPWPVAADG